MFEAGSKFLSVSFKFDIWLYTCWNGIILLNWCMCTGIYTVLIGMACVILMNFFNVSSVCLFVRGSWRLDSSLFVLVVWFVVFCGTLEICCLLPVEVIIDSVNDMAAISRSQ